MYNKYFNISNNNFANIIYILISAFLLNSCQTVSISRIEPESVMLRDTLIEYASHLVLKNNTKISLEDKELYYMSKYKDSVNVLLMKDTKEYKIRDTVKNVTRIYYKETSIPISEVKDIFLEKKEIDSESTIVTVITAALITGAIVLIYSVHKYLSGLEKTH